MMAEKSPATLGGLHQSKNGQDQTLLTSKPPENLVSVPRHELIQLQQVLKAQQSKLQACSNLNMLVFEKDREIFSLREQNKHLEVNLQQTEVRLVNSLKTEEKLQLESFRRPEPAEGPAAAAPRHTKLLARGASDRTTNSDSGNMSGNLPENISYQPKPKMSMALLNTAATRSMEEPFNSLTSSSFLSTSAPGVSRVMFENVVKDNIKLKKKLSELLKQDGKSMKQYLEQEEYAEIVKNLQHELKEKDEQIIQLDTILKSSKDGNVNVLARSLSLLQSKFAKAEKAVTAGNSLRETLSREAESLRSDKHKLDEKIEEMRSKLDAYYDRHGPLLDGSTEHLDLARLNISDSNLSENVEALVERLTAVEKSLERSRSNEANQRSEISHLKNGLTRAAEEKENLSTKIQELEIKCAGLSCDLSEKTSLAASHNPDNWEQSQKEMKTLKQLLQKTQEEKGLYEAQMQLYLTDFNAEKDDKDRQKKIFEKHLNQQQIHIRRLSIEAENLSKLLNEERRKNQQSQPLLGATAGETSAPYMMLPCGLQGASGHYGNDRPMIVASDGYVQEFECPRCMRIFQDQSEWQSHCDKCLDT